MSQPATFWQKYGTLAQMAQAAVALLGFVAILFQINEIRTNNRAASARQAFLGYTDLAFKNPKRDSVLYLHFDNPGGIFTETQKVQVSAGGTPIQDFEVVPAREVIKKIPISAAQLGAADSAEVELSVDKTFVPANLPGSPSKDPRELGIRVFHAFV